MFEELFEVAGAEGLGDDVRRGEGHGETDDANAGSLHRSPSSTTNRSIGSEDANSTPMTSASNPRPDE